MLSTLESVFRSTEPHRGNYLSRLFGLFSEDIVRHWCRCPDAPYDDLGRPFIRLNGDHGHTLDFAFRCRDTGRVFVSELKAEIAWESYQHLRLSDTSSIDHHLWKPAFQKLLKAACDPSALDVRVGGRQQSIDGAVLVWGAITPNGRQAAMDKYRFADVLSLEDMLANLSSWQPSHWLERVNELRRWSNELFEYLRHPNESGAAEPDS